METISLREFTRSGDKYFDLALTQPVFLRRRQRLFVLRATDTDDVAAATVNPSPSGDPYFLNPANLAAIERGARDAEAGRVTWLTPEARKKIFGDV